ncbi:MAG: VOC family protein [Myxococcota bacterium]
MKPLDRVRTLRRDADLEREEVERILARERARFMTTIEAAARRELGARHVAQRIIPQLPYHDVPAARDFLERVFGFTERHGARVVDTKTGELVHTAVELHGAEVMLGGHGGHGASSPKSGGVISQVLTVYVDDVDAHHARARAEGARVVEGLADKFFGDRTYEVLDLEGHRWRFHQRMRDVPPEELRWSSEDDG